jgi:predicted Zn-dependent protease
MSDRMRGPTDRLIRRVDDHRFLSLEECDAIAQRVKSFAQGGGETGVGIAGWWKGELRWARNRVSLASDRRDLTIRVSRTIDGGAGGVTTNQVDDVSLAAAVRAAERSAGGQSIYRDLAVPPPLFDYPKPAIWSDASYNVTTEERGQVVRELLDPAEAAGMLSAGYLEVLAQASYSAGSPLLYSQQTQAQCSVTVRDEQGTGSGWAGLSSYDWSRIDAGALAKRALEKGLASRNPVALEPGRYTVILEPQAVHDLVQWLVIAFNDGRNAPEKNGAGPFFAGYDNALQRGRSKLGLKVVDERITISHDPMDPMLGLVPFYFDRDGVQPVRPVTWIDRGVLTALAYDRRYATQELNDNLSVVPRGSYRMSGGPSSIDEMIRTTARGLLVTRFWNVTPLDGASVLLTGLTRDGVWLIEHGKITHAVKNFRFTESPLFALNSLEQLGEPVPVFSPNSPAVVPPLKVRDFSFTSLVDAV